MSPTQRSAILTSLIALSAFWLPAAVAGAVFAVLVLAIGVDATLVRSPPTVLRRAPTLAARGVPAELTVVVSHGRGRVETRQPAIAEISLANGQSLGNLDTLLTARRRGRHHLPPPNTRTTGPLGLARWTHTHGNATSIDVYPDLPAAARIARAVTSGRFRDEGTNRGPLGLGTNFEQVREYLPDDDIRQVNWLASARMQRPMSNQFREDRDREVLVAIDTGRLMMGGLGDGTRLDAALDALAAVAAVADAVGDRFGAITFDQTVHHNLRPRRVGGAAVVRALYDLEPTSIDSDYERAFQVLRGSKRALLIVFTDLVEESAARPLVAAADVLCASHAVVVVSARDPSEAASLATPPEAPVDVYRAAILAELAASRDAVASRLRAAGARVVEAPPDRLATACVAAYLRLKALARF